jgi:hypothetical protein
VSYGQSWDPLRFAVDRARDAAVAYSDRIAAADEKVNGARPSTVPATRALVAAADALRALARPINGPPAANALPNYEAACAAALAARLAE